MLFCHLAHRTRSVHQCDVDCVVLCCVVLLLCASVKMASLDTPLATSASVRRAPSPTHVARAAVHRERATQLTPEQIQAQRVAKKQQQGVGMR